MSTNLVRLSPSSSVPRLLCLPYAGGRGDFYRRWVADLIGVLELWTIDLPGRYRRFDQEALTDLDDVIAGITTEAADLTDRPLAVFGHSMGAMLGIGVVRGLEQCGPPLHGLIVSGCAAPHLGNERPTPSDRSDQALIALLRRWGATPPELLDNDEFLNFALPALRADLLLCDQYRASPGRISTPLTALAGLADTTAPPETADAWKECSTNWRGLRTLPGGHFFIHTDQRATIDAIVAATSAGQIGVPNP